MALEQLQSINESALSSERASEVLFRTKLEFARIAVFNSSFPFLKKLLRKRTFKKLMNARTLNEYAKERTRLSDENIYLGSYCEDFTQPFVGLTEDELCALGLGNTWVKGMYEANREWTSYVYSTLGAEEFRNMYGDDEFVRFALKLKRRMHV